jgi:hypothetical protein
MESLARTVLYAGECTLVLADNRHVFTGSTVANRGIRETASTRSRSFSITVTTSFSLTVTFNVVARFYLFPTC